MKDLEQHAFDRISETLDLRGSQPVADVLNAIADLDSDFDAESWCPYYTQQDDVISQYESDFGRDAEDITDGKQYPATEWQQAKTAYAYAIAWAAFESFWSAAKEELKDAIEEFAADVNRELELGDELQIQITGSCLHGWAAHDRELADGTMIWESGQLDGCNAMERSINGVWVSCCLTPLTSA